jgi:hypothetical protein
MIAATLEYPFDLAKVRLQSQLLFDTNSAPLRFNGPWDCFVKTWKYEGVRGLYRVRLYLPAYIHDVVIVMVPGIADSRSRRYGRDSCSLSFLFIFPESHPVHLRHGKKPSIIDTPTRTCGGRRRLCYQLRPVSVKVHCIETLFKRNFRCVILSFAHPVDSFRTERP